MNEKIIIKSEKWSVKGICIGIIAVGLTVGFYLVFNSGEYSRYDDNLLRALSDNYFWLSIVPFYFSMSFLPSVIISVLLYFMGEKNEITVTDKRVYGKAIFGKRVDLPVDSISAVGTSMLKGIAVGTSSGRIKFLGISNRDAIHKEISSLILERQNKKNTTSPNVIQDKVLSKAEELKKYKDLLDAGVITQEEFDAKKKQLLDL